MEMGKEILMFGKTEIEKSKFYRQFFWEMQISKSISI